ncbi:unnamed protein product, partial [Choristocarpus tenellus]
MYCCIYVQSSSVLVGLEKLFRQEPALFEGFFEIVTDDIAPGYSEEIALPMHLSLIMDRLRLGYYRSCLAVLADLRLLGSNCCVYNPA